MAAVSPWQALAADTEASSRFAYQCLRSSCRTNAAARKHTALLLFPTPSPGFPGFKRFTGCIESRELHGCTGRPAALAGTSGQRIMDA
jgi:hypothetical protein